MNSKPEPALRAGRTRASQTGYFDWLFQTTSEGILILDADTGEVIDVNLWLLHLLARPIDEVVGRRFWELSPDDEAQTTRRTFALMQKVDRARHTDLLLQGGSGQRIETEFISNAYRVDGRFIIQCDLRAVSETPRLERFTRSQPAEIERASTEKAELALCVLLVEDSAFDARLVREDLSTGASPFLVDHVESLGEALNRLREHTFDAVLLDLQLPDFTGLSAFEILRRAAPETAMVVLTDEAQEALGGCAVHAGAQDFVVKGTHGHLHRVLRYAIERRLLEKRLVQASKTDMVAQLTAGIAHDFNNQLSVIFGYTEFILTQLDAGDPLHESAEEVRLAAERAASLTRQLLLFSRHDAHDPSLISINAVIRGLEKMFCRLAGTDVHLTFDLDEALDLIYADPVLVGQVIMNLVVNARDAMPEGGTLAVTTRNRPGNNGSAPSILLSVRDSGCGISEEVRSRLFEAFYTTKQREHRTGLGLAICQHIVEQAGGHIEVESEPGLGAEFRLCFPKSDRVPETQDDFHEELVGDTGFSTTSSTDLQ